MRLKIPELGLKSYSSFNEKWIQEKIAEGPTFHTITSWNSL
jgi:hypothetical protein